ncbi:MAG: type II secretion system ATPase GspE [Lentisphaeria bacterium]|nr:type II secretion system ATPase GspE [Lentisphaeria bacterium]
MDAEVSAIWHLLLDSGKADEEQLEEVFDEHERTGRPFTTVLYNYEIIQEDELLAMIAENLGTEFVQIHLGEIPDEIIATVKTEVARMYQIVPLYEEDGVLHVVALEPTNYRMIDELHFLVGRECRVLVGRPHEIEEALEHFYPEGAGSLQDVLGELESTHKERYDISADDIESLEAVASDAPIVKFVNLILAQAIKDQASDIHFEPFADEFRIRYRIDGALYEMAPPPKHLATPVISRIKVMSNLNIAERRLPQDGRIERRINGRQVDLRVSSLPTQYGESVVLRVLDRSVVDLDLDKLGMNPDVLHKVRLIIHRPNGIFIVTGPTGCGKTTTLYSGLKEINTIEDKLLTAEDPVEYDLEGIMQLQVREAVKMTFANALRSFLRQDPDRIMVGEIRDVETASMAIQASLTGHLVMTTLHTNDAAGAITRLLDMGVEPFLISSTLVGVLAQRLIRRVCTACKTAYEPKDEELELLGMTREAIGGKPFHYGRGCEVCSNTGFRGRLGIFELLRITPEIQRMINKRLPTQNIRECAIEQGMMTMRNDGIMRVIDGTTTAEEVLTYTSFA